MARNINGQTIYSALSIFQEGGVYYSGIFNNFSEKRQLFLEFKTLFINKILMVKANLLNFILWLFSKLLNDPRPFGNLNMVLYRDLMQLSPIHSLFVFKSDLWQFFHLLFLDEP